MTDLWGLEGPNLTRDFLLDFSFNNAPSTPTASDSTLSPISSLEELLVPPVEKSSIEGDQTKLKKTMRKLSHRKVEKNRRDKLNEGFEVLLVCFRFIGPLLKRSSCLPRDLRFALLEDASSLLTLFFLLGMETAARPLSLLTTPFAILL